MTGEHFVAIVKQVKYKPSFLLSASCVVSPSHIGRTCVLRIESTQPDAFNVKEVATPTYLKAFNEAILENMTEEDTVEMVRRSLQEYELHELDEWFEYEGKRIHYPHQRQGAEAHV